MEGLIEHLLNCSRLNQEKLQLLKVGSKMCFTILYIIVIYKLQVLYLKLEQSAQLLSYFE